MFSELLKRLRAKAGVTQPQLAVALGVSKGNVGDWETGKSKPGFNALVAIAQFFNVSTDFLLGLDSGNHENTGQEDICDLTEAEVDLLMMYRMLDGRDKKEIFSCMHLKYKRMLEDEEEFCSTYTDMKSSAKSDPDEGSNAASGIA